MSTSAIARLMAAPARSHSRGGRATVRIRITAAAGQTANALRHGNTLEDLTPRQRFALSTPVGAAWANWIDERHR